MSMLNYQYLLDDLQAILVERRYQARELKIRTMHEVGQSVLTSPLYEGNAAPLLRRLGQDLALGRSELYACIQFAQAEPDLEQFLSAHADGKVLSWATVKRQLLPANPQAPVAVDRPAARAYSLSQVGAVWSREQHEALCQRLGLTP